MGRISRFTTPPKHKTRRILPARAPESTKRRPSYLVKDPSRKPAKSLKRGDPIPRKSLKRGDPKSKIQREIR